METKIINGRKIRDEILETIKKEVGELSFRPVFCDVLVGDDPSSVQYVEMKGRTAEEVGIAFHRANFPVSISTEELVKEIEALNQVPHMCGIIIQLPLPESIDRQAVLDAIDPRLDVDCLGRVASEKFYRNESGIAYPTALACMAVLDSLPFELKDKQFLVLGQGLLVGRPVTAMLKFRNIIPEIVTRETENRKEKIKNADVVISGMGQGEHITGEMIKEGAILVDAGTSESNGAIVGDVDLPSVQGIAGYVSPVPGGVGPVTVAMLLRNVLTIAKTK